MFIPYIIRHISKNNKQYALICTAPLFYVLAPTCFGSGLPSRESVLDHSDLPEIEWVGYLKYIQIQRIILILFIRYTECPRRKGQYSGRSHYRSF
jgi:hypothetical protein